MNSDSKRTSWQYDAAILAILTLPFLLNDFANIFVLDYRIWLGIDYVFVKALPLFLIFRGLWVSILKRYVSSRIVPVVLSSLIFGLIHWRGVGEPTIPSLQQLP
ncbi:MAG: hypothetical protein K9N62_10590 [Verrucomicrobia bacterium]|nr:hypothetical protein [Verrucomicrobiota bacterium]